MPLFETSTLFHLLAAYMKYSQDTAFISAYIPRLELYASYLANNSFYPENQIMTVDAIAPTANQTGLAIQSAIGLRAASWLLNNDTYSTVAYALANQIYNQGLGLDTSSPSNSTHFTWNYGNSSSWGTLFTAYVDVLLELDTFPTAAWDMQTRWYLTQNQPAGLPFFGTYNDTLSLTSGGCDWTITDWTVSIILSSSTMSLITYLLLLM